MAESKTTITVLGVTTNRVGNDLTGQDATAKAKATSPRRSTFPAVPCGKPSCSPQRCAWWSVEFSCMG